VGEILQRAGVWTPGVGRRGAKPRAQHLFYGLIRCPQAHVDAEGMPRPVILTPNRYSESTGVVTFYRCSLARTMSDHGKASVSERIILEWAKNEAARLTVPADAVRLVEQNGHAAAALEARRRRVIENYEDGLIDKTERDRKVAEIVAKMADLDAAHAVVELPPTIDWTWKPEKINAILRAMWRGIDLGPDMHPVAADWIVPEWRGADGV
jgi:hypothetical protein